MEEVLHRFFEDLKKQRKWTSDVNTLGSIQDTLVKERVDIDGIKRINAKQ